MNPYNNNLNQKQEKKLLKKGIALNVVSYQIQLMKKQYQMRILIKKITKKGIK